MASFDEQIQKMARMHRHAKRAPEAGLGLNNLKPRFSPTAIFDNPGSTSAVPNAATPAPVTTTTPAAVQPVTTPKTPVTTAKVQTTTAVAAGNQNQQTTTSTSAPATTTAASSAASTTTTAAAVTTTSSTAPVVTTPTKSTSTDISTTFVTTTFRSVAPVDSATGTLTSSTASATPTATGGMSTTGIIGIAAAAVVGVSVLAGVGMYFLRRWNRRREEEYDPQDFRRQSVVLSDEAPSGLYRGNSGGAGSGYGRGPRPPTMIERHYANLTAPQPPSTAYQPPQQYGGPNAYGDYAAPPVAVPSFSPGEIVSPVSPGPGSTPPHVAQYANVPASFYSPMGQSPIASPASVAPYGSAYDDQGRLVRSPSNGAAVALTRGNSVGNPQAQAQHPGLEPPSIPENDYMDVTRASVTPFQAEQYVAISQKLNIPPPVPLPQVNEKAELEQGNNVSMSATKQSMESPFEDPQDNGTHYQSARPSSEFHEHNPVFPQAEPVPRVPSIAPVLPDIQLPQRTFSPLSFPASPSPRRANFGADATAPPPIAAGSARTASPLARADIPPLSPVTSSPRRAQFVSGEETRAHDGRETPVEIGFAEPASTPSPAVQAVRQQTSAPAPASAEKKRPETLYDDEDAYGGF